MIDILNKLGMVAEDDKNYVPKTKNWEKSLEALRLNKSPKAQALYNKLLKKYKIVDN